jgi:hypothetical protein
VGASTQNHILAAQTDELGYSQTGLAGYQQESAVPSAYPSRCVRSREQGFELSLFKKSDDFTLVAFAGHGQDTLTDEGVRRLGQCDVSKEGVDSRQTRVAGGSAITPVCL